MPEREERKGSGTATCFVFNLGSAGSRAFSTNRGSSSSSWSGYALLAMLWVWCSKGERQRASVAKERARAGFK